MTTLSLVPTAQLQLRPVRGRLTLLAPGDLSALRVPVSGDGYAVPPHAAHSAAVGASYELDGGNDGIEAEHAVHCGNLERLARLLLLPPAVQPRAIFDAVRCVSHDRLPLAGRLADDELAWRHRDALGGAQLADVPRHEGLHVLTALGSRGLTLAPLMAELLAAEIEGAPLPLERDLVSAVDPARLLLRRLRRGRAGVRP